MFSLVFFFCFRFCYYYYSILLLTLYSCLYILYSSYDQ